MSQNLAQHDSWLLVGELGSGAFLASLLIESVLKISTEEIMDQPRKGGFGLLGATVLLCLPSLFAVFTSSAIAQSAGTGSSALWFMFQVSQYVGSIGIVVAAALVVLKVSEGQISRIAIGLMTISVLAAIFLQWYAIHIYRSPWF